MYPHDHPSSSLSLEILKKYNNKIFIETGCNTGQGVKIALSAGFEKIISMDIEEKYINICKNKFLNNKEVEIFLADSGKDLYEIIKNIDTPITFWLDGHGYYSVPLLKELAQIKDHPIKTHTILIDDVRMFSTKEWNDLSQQEAIDEIKKINLNYKISYEDSYNGKNDILVAKI